MIIYLCLLCAICLMAEVTKHIDFNFYFCYLKRKICTFGLKDLGFWLIFVCLSLFSAFRDGVGIDYDSYIMHVRNIQLGNASYMEVGFQKLCLLVQSFTDNPRVVLIICAIVTCFFFTKAIFDQSQNITMSFFIFLAWGYYFLTFNTVRNYLALAIVLYAIKFIQSDKKSRYIIFILLVLLAATFHKSALICIPLYFFAKVNLKQKHVLLLTGGAVALLVLKNYIRHLVFIIYPGYQGGAYDTGRISWLNIIKAVLAVGIALLYYQYIKDDKKNRFYFNLNVFSLIYYVALYWMPEVSRLGFYMNATSILLIPNLSACLNSKNRKAFCIMIYGTGLLLFIFLMITFKASTTQLLPYKTWLFK